MRVVRGFVVIVALIGLVTRAVAQDHPAPMPPGMSEEICHRDLQQTLMDFRQCQTSSANVAFRWEREQQRLIDQALAQRDSEWQGKLLKLQTDFTEYKKANPAPPPAAPSN